MLRNYALRKQTRLLTLPKFSAAWELPSIPLRTASKYQDVNVSTPPRFIPMATTASPWHSQSLLWRQMVNAQWKRLKPLPFLFLNSTELCARFPSRIHTYDGRFD